MIDGNQMTLTWHVDDIKSSHVNPKVNDEFLKWLQKEYGQLAAVKATRGKVHDYLGMTLDYNVHGSVCIDMRDYVKGMTEEFPSDHYPKRKVTSAAAENIFSIDPSSPPLSEDQASFFRTIVLKGLFLAKRGRPDLLTTINFLCGRAKQPTQQDWTKLQRLMKVLQQTMDDVLTLTADGSHVARWYVDAAFACHSNMVSQTGGCLTLGDGIIFGMASKQKLNTRSSTESELVAVDDMIGQVLWTRRFLESQEYYLRDCIIYQDNQSAIKMETNGRSSAGKRSRHIDIRYFFITDQVKKGYVTIKFCPTDGMIADYFSKPLHGMKFREFRMHILGLHE